MSINGIGGGIGGRSLEFDRAGAPRFVNGGGEKRGGVSGVFEPGMTLDEVSISDEARALWEQSVRNRGAYAGKTGGDVHKEIGFTEEDLSPVKDAFRLLAQAKKGVDRDIDSILKKAGVRLSPGERLKVEFDGDGNVIVGGVKDAKTAKAIEKALNGDAEFVEKFRAYRNQEMSVSGDLKETAGMSLEDYRNRLSAVQHGDLDGKVFKTNGGGTYTNEELAAFKDQDLNRADSEFMEAIGEYLQSGSKYDIAPGSDILSDPAAAMNGAMQDIRENILKSFRMENDKLRDQFDAADPEEAAILDSMMMRLDNVKIQIDADGSVRIDGNVSGDERMNRLGKSLIEGFARDMLRVNPVTGEKSGYAVAAERLENLYEDEYGEAAGGGKAVSSITNGEVESHIDSPKKKEELRAEVRNDVNSAVKKMGGTLDEELEIAIDEDGKISVSNLPSDGKDREIVLDILDRINSGEEGGGAIKDILSGIAEKLEQFGVLSAGGAGKLDKAL